jgi:hypothetical protein
LVISAVQQNLCTIEDLVAELAACPRNYSGFFRRAVDDVLAGALSITEAEAIDALRQRPLPAFEANVPIVTRTGVVIARADVLWRELRAVLEVEGRRYHLGYDQRTGTDKWEKSMGRHSMLTRRGLSVDHYSPQQLRRDPAAWAKGIEQWLRMRAAELRLPYRPLPDPLQMPAVPGQPEPFVVPDLPI